MEQSSVTEATPLAVSVAAAVILLGIGRTKLYQLMAAGEVRSFQLGRRRLILAEDIFALVSRLVAENK